MEKGDIVITKEDLGEEPKVKITEADLPSHLSENGEVTDPLLVCVDGEKNLWVTLGLPLQTPRAAHFQIPNQPHVFMVHRLRVTDASHDETIENVPVIFAHGGQMGKTWVFGDGQPIIDTTKAYNQYTETKGLPKVEMVISCNYQAPEPVHWSRKAFEKLPKSLRPNFLSKILPMNPNDIQVKDFDLSTPVAQAVGEVLYFAGGRIDSHAKVEMAIKADGKIWGLDELLISKQVKIAPSPSKP